MPIRKASCTVALLTALLSSHSATAETTLRIAMTASDIPTATGLPNNGFEGMRFLGYPIFEGLVLWDLTRTDRLATLRPGLAEKWEQDPSDNKTWIFHLRQGVKFHDGTDFNADAVIWNLDRYFNKREPAIRAAEFGDVAGARAGDGQLQEDRRRNRRHHHHEAGLLFSLYGGLSPVHLAGIVREGGQGVGQGRDLAGGRHRAVPDHQGGAAAGGRSGALGRLLGRRPERRRSTMSC